MFGTLWLLTVTAVALAQDSKPNGNA